MNFAYAKRYDMSAFLHPIQLKTVNLCDSTIITVNVPKALIVESLPYNATRKAWWLVLLSVKKISLQFTVMNFAYAKCYDMSAILYPIQLQTVNLCDSTIIVVNVPCTHS